MLERQRWFLGAGGLLALALGLWLMAVRDGFADAVLGGTVTLFGASILAMVAPLPPSWRMGLGALLFALTFLLIAVVATFWRDALPVSGGRRSLTQGSAPFHAVLGWFGAAFFGLGAVLSAWSSARMAVAAGQDPAEESMG